MKKTKKVLSVLLVLVIVIINIPFSRVVSSAVVLESNEETDFDFGAIEEMVNSYVNKADKVNFNEYLSSHYTNPTTITLIESGMNQSTIVPLFVEDMENNTLFKAAYGSWLTANFVANPGNAMEHMLNKELFYETVLFRLLKTSVTSENAIDWLNQGAITNSVDFCELLTNAAEFDYLYDVYNRLPISELTQAEKKHLEELANNYINSQGYKFVNDKATFIKNALEISASVEEFGERMGSYLQLARLAETTVTFLEMVKTNSDDKTLNNALETVIAVSNDSFWQFMGVATKEAACTIGTSVLKSYFSVNWGNALSSIFSSGLLSTGTLVVNAAFLANNIGIAIGNVCFNTDGKMEKYELMKALAVTEEAVKNTVTSLLVEGVSGYLISEGIDILYSMYVLDCDLCLELASEMDKEWIKLSTEEEREQLREDINTVKKYYESQYNSVVPKKGVCGDSLYWVFNYISGELIIYGLGAMYDYNQGSAPWYIYKDKIKSVYVSSLCSQVGEYAFYNLSELRNPLIFSSYTLYAVRYDRGCFDLISDDVPIVFTNDAEVWRFANTDNVVYAMKSLECRGGSVFSKLYVNEELYVSESLALSSGGELIAGSLDSGSMYLEINSNATVEIYGDACIVGEDHTYSGYEEVYYDALKMYDGASLNVYGEATFCSGLFYVYSGANIFVAENCSIDAGSILQDVFFYVYGSIVADGRLAVKGGYLTNALLIVYGEIVMGDFYATCGAGDSVGVACIKGRAYITNANQEHNLNNFVMIGKNAYLSVCGTADDINGYFGGVVFSGIGDGPSSGTIELYGDASFSDPGEEDLTVVLSGEKQQVISGYNGSITAGAFIINNSNGVVFEDTVTSLELFNHNQNPFVLKKDTNVFQDYDNDGVLDNIDVYPLDPLNGAYAEDFTVEISDSSLVITEYLGDEKNLVIPDCINGYKVVAVKCSFAGSGLESITLGKYVSSVGTSAFNDVSTLKNIYVSEENNTYVSYNGILYTKNGDTLVRYPMGKTDLLYVVLDTVSVIDSNAFNGCNNIEKIKLPDSLGYIKYRAFKGCSNLKEITIPEDVVKIYQEAFLDCHSLTTINYNAVAAKYVRNSGLLNSNINPNVFKGCPIISEIIIGKNVEELPVWFGWADSMKTINLPATIKKIDKNAFKDSLLETINYDGTRYMWRQVNILTTALSDVTINCISVVSPIDNSVFDEDNGFVYGLDIGFDSLDGYADVTVDGYHWEYTSTDNGLGTGSEAILTNGTDVIDGYTVVIFGDIDGNGWYDANDAFLVKMLVSGLLTREVVGEAVYKAADCNHDGVVDGLDVQLLEMASILLDDVNQSATQAELSFDSSYIEYCSLIDQSAGFEAEPAPEENNAEQPAETQPEAEFSFDLLAIFRFIFSIFEKLFTVVVSLIG